MPCCLCASRSEERRVGKECRYGRPRRHTRYWRDWSSDVCSSDLAIYARQLLLEELELAIDELPEEQHEVFVAHELDGRSFKEIAAETGVSVNTMLSRKRYAVLHLRKQIGRASCRERV